MSLGRISQENLSAEEELFLFGNQDGVSADLDMGKVISIKHDFSLRWLAQFWQGEIPDYFFEDEAAYRREVVSLNEQLASEAADSTLIQKPPVRENPVAHELYREWLNDHTPQHIEERTVFNTALYYAYRVLKEKDDPQRDAKLGYVIDLMVESDRIVFGSTDPGPEFFFPEPLEGYGDVPFPAHLVDEHYS